MDWTTCLQFWSSINVLGNIKLSMKKHICSKLKGDITVTINWTTMSWTHLSIWGSSVGPSQPPGLLFLRRDGKTGFPTPNRSAPDWPHCSLPLNCLQLKRNIHYSSSNPLYVWNSIIFLLPNLHQNFFSPLSGRICQKFLKCPPSFLAWLLWPWLNLSPNSKAGCSRVSCPAPVYGQTLWVDFRLLLLGTSPWATDFTSWELQPYMYLHNPQYAALRTVRIEWVQHTTVRTQEGSAVNLTEKINFHARS